MSFFFCLWTEIEEKDGHVTHSSIRGLWLRLVGCHCSFIQLKDLLLEEGTIYVSDCLIHVIAQINLQLCVCIFFFFCINTILYHYIISEISLEITECSKL